MIQPLPTGYANLLLALAIGFLIGIERGWRQRDEAAGARVAGIRSFSLLGLLGGILGLAVNGPLRDLASLLAAAAMATLLLGYKSDMDRDGNVSATTTLAALTTLILGAFATQGYAAIASIGAGALVILLASRHSLHQAIRFTSQTDLRVLLRLVLVVFVILPILPDQPMGPFGALNPRRLWLVAVVTVSISFAGYALARWLGQRRGALIGAVVGALVSSTAVTLESARRLRDGASGRADEAGVALASFIMFARALLLVALLAPYALGAVAMLIGPASLVAALAGGVLLLQVKNESGVAPARAPKAPGLGLALLFAATVAALALISAWAQARLGEEGGALVIAIGGTADIDAAIAAVGALPPGTLPLRVAGLALAAPILFNTLFKLAILVSVAGVRRPARAVVALGATGAAILVPIAIALA
jgi:uncharacterized membrane protein (DUF4010 family)